MGTPLDPAPLTSPLAQKDGTPSPAWSRWFSLLQSIFSGYATPSGVQAPSFLNSWTNFGSPWQTAAYWLDAAGWVHLIGQVKGGASGTVVFQLPSGFRPSSNVQFAVMFNNAFGYATVDPSGNVTLTATGTASEATLNGIAFPAGG